jgi:hypothetical protein
MKEQDCEAKTDQPKPITWPELVKEIGIPMEHFQAFCCEAIGWMCADQPGHDSIVIQVRDGRIQLGNIKGYAKWWLPRYLELIEKEKAKVASMVGDALRESTGNMVDLHGNIFNPDSST